MEKTLIKAIKSYKFYQSFLECAIIWFSGFLVCTFVIFFKIIKEGIDNVPLFFIILYVFFTIITISSTVAFLYINKKYDFKTLQPQIIEMLELMDKNDKERLEKRREKLYNIFNRKTHLISNICFILSIVVSFVVYRKFFLIKDEILALECFINITKNGGWITWIFVMLSTFVVGLHDNISFHFNGLRR